MQEAGNCVPATCHRSTGGLAPCCCGPDGKVMHCPSKTDGAGGGGGEEPALAETIPSPHEGKCCPFYKQNA